MYYTPPTFLASQHLQRKRSAIRTEKAYLIGCRPTPGLDEFLPELSQLHHAARLRGMRHAHLHTNIYQHQCWASWIRIR
jgi:hypothetical protein